jgi:hypothetical protein
VNVCLVQCLWCFWRCCSYLAQLAVLCQLCVGPLWCCLMQAGPVAGMRSLGLDIVNSSPVLKHTILRIAMHGL